MIIEEASTPMLTASLPPSLFTCKPSNHKQGNGMEWSADLNSEDFCRSPLTHSVLQSISLSAAGVICDMISLFTREMTEPVRAPCMAFFTPM